MLRKADPTLDVAPLRRIDLAPLTLSGRVTAIRDVLAGQVPDAGAVDALLSAAIHDDRLAGW